MEYKKNTEIKTGVIFQNIPKVSEHAVHVKRNEKWEAILPVVQDFISNHPRFKGQEVKVTHPGISSYIAVIETPEEKIVLKIATAPFQENEPNFLKKWEEAGVKVPHVFEMGMLGDDSYFLMEYIDAKTLDEAYNQAEMVDKNIYREMGHTLRAMHGPEAKGWGSVINGEAEFETFSKYVESPGMVKKINYARENNLLSEEHGSLEQAKKILVAFTDNKPTSYCHNDFGSKNIFATHPITVFDPNPVLQNGYLDLGRSLVLHAARGVYPEQLVEGYLGQGTPNPKVLFAAVLLNAYIKLAYWHKIKKFEQIKNIQEYLKANKHSLD